MLSCRSVSVNDCRTNIFIIIHLFICSKEYNAFEKENARLAGIVVTLLHTCICNIQVIRFYRAMHFSAKRGIVIACRLSVCNVGEL